MLRLENILVIDDNVAFSRLFSIYFKSNFPLSKVYTANKQQNGIDMVKDNNYDLIFIDTDMPGKDGLQVYEEIKDYVKDRGMIVIGMSTYDGNIDKWQNAGVPLFLKKEEVNNKRYILSMLLSENKS